MLIHHIKNVCNCASLSGLEKVVESLIQNGANVNIPGRFGESAIIKAAVKGLCNYTNY